MNTGLKELEKQREKETKELLQKYANKLRELGNITKMENSLVGSTKLRTDPESMTRLITQRNHILGRN